MSYHNMIIITIPNITFVYNINEQHHIFDIDRQQGLYLNLNIFRPHRMARENTPRMMDNRAAVQGDKHVLVVSI